MDYLDCLGGLHDSRITELHWNMEGGILTVQIDNFFANCLGFPEYPGKVSGPLTFRDISGLACDYAQAGAYLWIYEASIIQAE